MLIVDKKSFNIGLGLLISFLVVLALMLSPVIDGKTILIYSEDLFNSLTKGSTYQIPAVEKSAEKFAGTSFSVSVKAADAAEGEQIAKVYGSAGADVKVDSNKVDISGDLGKISLAALKDADALFNGRVDELKGAYGMDGKEVIYCWYGGFKALNKQYKLDAKSSEMSFTGNVMSKALEPAYNFEGIKPVKVREKMGVTGFLLTFYVIYTVWFGFAVMYLFEGMGITATAAKKKLEA
ncbi:hypothetical protein DCCM_0356 [Desulfocucumis palustris]|uniref:Uncharacterized protein n=1 Tax=Desulfocucumis palustris TaxID=1898651 RepID=A0A2L2X7M0_9FIRM|nr:hypothetical protein [Desulfocucumis palustris]GBF32165.1 hypothetical protein DCCM_0356 [Desulfocucumis palustris]